MLGMNPFYLDQLLWQDVELGGQNSPYRFERIIF